MITSIESEKSVVGAMVLYPVHGSVHMMHVVYFYVVCAQGDIRLRGGANNMTGRVEFCNNQVWGTVCDDAWGAVDARVVCRQLGFAATGMWKCDDEMVQSAANLYVNRCVKDRLIVQL